MKNKIILGALISTISLSGAYAMDMTSGNDGMMRATDTMMLKEKMMNEGKTMKDTMKPEMMDDKAMSPTKDAGMGARGAHVIALQKYLISKGFLTLPEGAIMGYYGGATKRAVMAYQESIGVKATGYFGPKTRMMMKGSMNMKDDSSMMKKDSGMMKDVMKDTMAQ